VGEGVGNDVPACLFLQPIVAHGAGGAQALFHVAGLQNPFHALGVMGPYAGEKIGLQLQTHREMVLLRLAHASALPVYQVHVAEELLHVVADLVGQDVRYREIARGLEPGLQFLAEAQVQVYLLVAGGVEGPHGRAGHAAARAHLAGVEHQLRLPIRPLGVFLKQFAPDVFRVCQHDGHELLQRLLRRVDLTRSGRRTSRLGRRLLEQRSRVAPQERDHQCQQQRANAPADGHFPDRNTAAVLHVVALSSTLPTHGLHLNSTRTVAVMHRSFSGGGTERHSQTHGVVFNLDTVER